MAFQVFGPPSFLEHYKSLWGGMNLDKKTISFIINPKDNISYHEIDDNIIFGIKYDTYTCLLMVKKGKWINNEMHWTFDEWNKIKVSYNYGISPMNEDGSPTQVGPNLFCKHEEDKIIFSIK